MKKMILAMAATVMMSVSAMAQDQQQERQPRQFDKNEMIKNRTEQLVKEYGLNEEQAGKLLTLNTEFFDKLPMMGRGGGPRGQRPQRPQTDEQRPRQGDRPQGERPRMNREEMQKQMEAYNAELEKIMTAEQYQKYQEDQKQRAQQNRQGGRRGGQRPQRPNND